MEKLNIESNVGLTLLSLIMCYWLLISLVSKIDGLQKPSDVLQDTCATVQRLKCTVANELAP